MDYYGFYTGKIFDAYRYLGAHVEEEGVTFCTFAPSAQRISLIGEFALQSLGNLTTGRNGNLIKLMTEISGNVMPKVQSRA